MPHPVRKIRATVLVNIHITVMFNDNRTSSGGSSRFGRPTQEPRLRALLPSAESVGHVEHLLDMIVHLAEAPTLHRILAILAPAARKLVAAAGAVTILGEGENAYYASEDSSQPLWTGQRFPITICPSGWVIANASPISVFDVSTDLRFPLELYRGTWIRSLAMVPICLHDPIGAIGVFWAAPHHSTQEQVRLLQALADAATIAIERCRIHEEMEVLVQKRTEELEAANRDLRKDALLRRRMEAKILHLSLTDELTSLNNRRGFLLRADQLFKLVHRIQAQAWLVYIDIDNLKKVNDGLGHEAGDRLIRGAARILRESFRDSDVLGRIGGDEFVVFATGSTTPLVEIQERLARNVAHYNECFPHDPPLSLSVGSIRCEPRSSRTLEELIHLADAAMYIDKRAKRKDSNGSGDRLI